MSLPPLALIGAPASKVLTELLASWAAGQALDAVFDAGLSWFDTSDGMPIADQTPQQLADGLSITVNMGDISQTQGDVAAVLSKIKDSPGAEQLLRTSLGGQAYQASNELNGNLANATDTQRQLVRNALNLRGGMPDGLTNDAAKALRSIRRKDTDGQRVSMERHEYVYCRDSNQIDDVYTAAGQPRNVQHSYGRFVDAPDMRRAIEKIRKVRRLSRSAGVSFVLNVMGLNIQDVIDNLVDAEPQFQQIMQAGVNQYNQ